MNPERSSIFIKKAATTGNSRHATSWSRQSAKSLKRAFRNNKLKAVKRELADGSLINTPIRSPRSLAGYTLLHIACDEASDKVAKLLIEEYHANVNAKTDEGIQPIHLAATRGYGEVVSVLLKAGVSLNTEIEKKFYFNRLLLDVTREKKAWLDDFGDKVTLQLFAILYDNGSWIAKSLITNEIDFNVTNPLGGNKTLLMYAIEVGTFTGECLIRKFRDQELLNVCDDDGVPATHYLLHPKYYGDFRYDANQLMKELHKTIVIRRLINVGADIHATINGDPDTLLINLAAYRGSSGMLTELLPNYDDISKSKALYFATLEVDLETSFCVDSSYGEEHQWGNLKRQRDKCTELVLKDLVNRRTFGLPVPPSESELMDELVAKNTEICNIVHEYEMKFIQKKLKNTIIEAEDESISLYDFILQICDEKRAKLLVKKKTLVDAFRKLNLEDFDFYYFEILLERILKKTCKRVELMGKLKEVEKLLDVIPLPYELILDIIEYFDNGNLDNFIAAFF